MYNFSIKKLFFAFINITAVILTGCKKPMTYPEFLNAFEKNCPGHYSLEDLDNDKKKQTCDCMLNHIKANYPDMQSLLAAIRAHDREPRGETDYVPSAFRITQKFCLTSDKKTEN
jgi:hypothetical protein